MNTKKKNFWYNPFAVAFICFALIVCLILGAVFLFVMYEQSSQSFDRYYQSKAETIVNDFSTHFDKLVSLSKKFSITETYMYSSVFKEKYNEYVLLEDFTQYRDYSFMTENMWLYYIGCSNIFHPSGNETFFHIYFSDLPQQDLLAIKTALNETSSPTQLISVGDTLYILIPFKADYGLAAQKATLGCTLDFSAIEKRFELVSGQIEGTVALYYLEQLVYCNDASNLERNDNNTISVVSQNGAFKLSYIPSNSVLFSVIDLLQMLLVFSILLIIVGLAYWFANKVYKPLQDISQKYCSTLSEPSVAQYNNIYEEIDGILDATLHNRLNDAAQLEQRQEMLKQHILKSLLNGAYIQDAEMHLQKLNVTLPGPFYYVISISFLSDIEPAFGDTIKQEIKKVASLSEYDHIFPIADYQKKQLWIICSISDREDEAELSENIQDILSAYKCSFKIGISNVHKGLNRLSACYLESMDKLHDRNKPDHAVVINQNFGNFQWLSTSLSTGNSQIAQQYLDKYVQMIRENQKSLLMQLYIFSEFNGELARICRSSGIELSKHTISLILSARNIDNFAESASIAIAEYCEKLRNFSLERANLKAQKVCEYVQAHFMDYDLSIEAIANSVGVSSNDARAAISNITGQKYTDYVTSLRIAYAKKLMKSEKLSVAEICEAVGYSSVSYFIRLFKEATGLTPAKYMKNISDASFENNTNTD